MAKNLEQRTRDLLLCALEQGELQPVKQAINAEMRPVEVARLIEASPPGQRETLWQLLERQHEGEVLQHLGDDIQQQFLRRMDLAELLDVTASMDDDDSADLLQLLPPATLEGVLAAMSAETRARLERVLPYPEDSAGGLMNTDVVTVRPDISVDACLRYLRLHSALPELTDSLMVVNRQGRLLGVLPLTRLLVSAPEQRVHQLMRIDHEAIHADTSDAEVASLFEQLDLVSAPVVDDQGLLLGRITIDDVVDVIREDADHSLMSLAGMDEDEDTFAPTLKTARRRALWLGINLLTAFMAAAVIGLFEQTINKVVALAVLMPIVASMGGIAGSQSLTLVIRAMAQGHIERSNTRWLLNRELIVGTLNGLLWAVAVAAAAGWWFEDPLLSGLIALALMINLFVAALCGTLLPLGLRARGIDPALAGGVVLTTITDVVGFFSFLGLASLFYA